MPDEPKKLFDLMDIETEPTDEQMAELMEFVAEAVRKKQATGQRKLNSQMTTALAEELVAKLLNDD